MGIVASRIAEEFCCPTFLICLEGDRGKASSRSYGGFNLFASLTQLSDLLESYGDTSWRQVLPFPRKKSRHSVRRFASWPGAFTTRRTCGPSCRWTARYRRSFCPWLTWRACLLWSPGGAGCPRPVFLLERLQIERLTPVGGGRHLRLRLRQGRFGVNAICFSATAESLDISQGELVDLACTLQINEFRGVRSVQVNLLDVRPSCPCPCPDDMAPYRRLADRALRAEGSGRAAARASGFGGYLAVFGRLWPPASGGSGVPVPEDCPPHRQTPEPVSAPDLPGHFPGGRAPNPGAAA
ncbi:MAG: hypothetical protein ACLSHU_06965 [Oscillospiraceae bacterium]